MDDAFEGAFYATCDRPRSWFRIPSKKDAGGGSETVDALYKSYQALLEQETSVSPEGPLARLSRAPEGSLSPRQAAQSKVQKYMLGSHGQCSLTVLPAASMIASHLVRVLPYVHSDDEVLLCFCGYLTNLVELAERFDVPQDAHGDTGALTTKVLLEVYRATLRDGGNSEQLFLSELQGQYALFLFDGQRKQPFAARDPSGEQELFFLVDSDTGCMSCTNSMEQLPPELQALRWREVPPGHFVAGSKHALHQFALTPQELAGRRQHESIDFGVSLAGSWDEDSAAADQPDTPSLVKQAVSKPKQLIAAAFSLSRRTSLE